MRMTPKTDGKIHQDEDSARMANMPECTAIQWRNIQQRQPSEIKAYGFSQFQTEFKDEELMTEIFQISPTVYHVWPKIRLRPCPKKSWRSTS